MPYGTALTAAARITAALAIASLLFPVGTRAQSARDDVIAHAELRSLTLTRRDLEAERRALQDQPTDATLIISNGCGEAIASFHILRATAPAPADVTMDLGIGEWCAPPIDFETPEWLIVMDGETGEVVARYPVFRQGEAHFALSEFGDRDLTDRPALTRRRLALANLPEPAGYPSPFARDGDALRAYVSSRPALELRGDDIWVVRAIPLQPIFPGIDAEEP